MLVLNQNYEVVSNVTTLSIPSFPNYIKWCPSVLFPTASIVFFLTFYSFVLPFCYFRTSICLNTESKLIYRSLTLHGPLIVSNADLHGPVPSMSISLPALRVRKLTTPNHPKFGTVSKPEPLNIVLEISLHRLHDSTAAIHIEEALNIIWDCSFDTKLCSFQISSKEDDNTIAKTTGHVRMATFRRKIGYDFSLFWNSSLAQ